MSGAETGGKPVAGHSELFKIKRSDFGGWQSCQLSYPQTKQRWCCAPKCAGSGLIQIPTGPRIEGMEGYRVVCAPHAIAFMVYANTLLGDPSPMEEARKLADLVGVDFGKVLAHIDRTTGISSPDGWQCVRCGGGMLERPRDRDDMGDLRPYINYIHHCTDREVSP